MKKIILILFLSMSFLSGCSKSLSDEIEGIKWRLLNDVGSSYYMVFYKGTTYSCSTYSYYKWKKYALYEFNGDVMATKIIFPNGNFHAANFKVSMEEDPYGTKLFVRESMSSDLKQTFSDESESTEKKTAL